MTTDAELRPNAQGQESSQTADPEVRVELAVDQAISVRVQRPRWFAAQNYGEYVLLAGVLLLAAALRVVWSNLMPVPPESDYATFYDMVHQLARGKWDPNGYGWLYKGPGYPLLL